MPPLFSAAAGTAILAGTGFAGGKRLLAHADADPAWFIVGMGAQAVLAFGLAGYSWAAGRPGRSASVHLAALLASLAANLTLLAYAWHRQDWVFLVGQAMAVLVGLWAVGHIHQAGQAAPPAQQRTFPVVAPDSAERKKVPPPPPPATETSGMSPQ
jgi:lipid-A-disaccharide synthase-like uncharacterized protein